MRITILLCIALWANISAFSQERQKEKKVNTSEQKISKVAAKPGVSSDAKSKNKEVCTGTTAKSVSSPKPAKVNALEKPVGVNGNTSSNEKSELRSLARDIKANEKLNSPSNLSEQRRKFIQEAERVGVKKLDEEEYDIYVDSYKKEFPSQYETKFKK